MPPLKLAFESILKNYTVLFLFSKWVINMVLQPHQYTLSGMVSWTLGFSLMTTTSISSVQISPLTTNLFYIFVLNCLQDVVNLGWSSGQTRLLTSRQKAWPTWMYNCLSPPFIPLSHMWYHLVNLRWNLSITLFPLLHPHHNFIDVLS